MQESEREIWQMSNEQEIKKKEEKNHCTLKTAADTFMEKKIFAIYNGFIFVFYNLNAICGLAIYLWKL